MKICFISSSYFFAVNQPAKGKKAWLHGITLPLLAAYAGREHSVTLINDFVHPLPDKNKFDVFFIVFTDGNFERARDLALTLKTIKNFIIVSGNTLDETTAAYLPFIDSVILGEAEACIEQIISDIKDKRLKKQYGKLSLLSSLENLPLPRYDLIDRKRHGFIYPVEATRGCPAIRSNNYVQSRTKEVFRKHPIEQIIRDIRYLKKIGVRQIFLTDENIFADKEFAVSLFKKIIPLKVKWICRIPRGVITDEELMKAAAASGLTAILNEETAEGFTKISGGKNIFRKMTAMKINSAIRADIKSKQHLRMESRFSFHSLQKFLLNIFHSVVKARIAAIYGEYSFAYINGVGLEKNYCIRIADGCSSKCSFCAIAAADRQLKSKSAEQCLKEFKQALDNGCKNITVTAEDVGAWGDDFAAEKSAKKSPVLNIASLLQQMISCGADRDYSLIIDSINPASLYCGLLSLEEIFHSPAVRRITVPVQSLVPRLLKLMRRFYGIPAIRQSLSIIRRSSPNIWISTHILIGFPSETKEELYETLSLWEELPFDEGCFFAFKPESGTPAEKIEGRISEKEIRQRMKLAHKYFKKRGFACFLRGNDFLFVSKKRKRKL